MTRAMTKQDGKRLRRLLMFAAVVLLVLTMVGAAGAWGKKKAKQEPKRGKNLNKAPTLAFETGMLQRGAFSGWTISDKLPVAFTERTVIIDEANGNQVVEDPYEGRRVSVSGHYVGGTLVLHTCKMRDPLNLSEHQETLTYEEAVEQGVIKILPEDTPH